MVCAWIVIMRTVPSQCLPVQATISTLLQVHNEPSIQIKSNQIIYLDKQIQKNVDKMSNEKTWARAQRAARASYMDPPKKKKDIRIRQHNKTC